MQMLQQSETLIIKLVCSREMLPVMCQEKKNNNNIGGGVR